MQNKLAKAIAASIIMGSASLGAQAAGWDVKVTNLSNGTHFTPLLVSAHSNATMLFQPGMAASANLRAMAECGDTSGLLTDLGGADTDTIDNPAAGLLAPGASTTAMITTSSTHLSLVAMMLPTNDGFVGLNSLQVPTAAGTYTYYLNAYDAGTEANNELMDTSGCVAGMAGIPADPTGAAGTGGTGVATADSNTMVHIHRGVLGDSNTSGGTSDLSNTVHRWQNPIAKVEITVTP